MHRLQRHRSGSTRSGRGRTLGAVIGAGLAATLLAATSAHALTKPPAPAAAQPHVPAPLVRKVAVFGADERKPLPKSHATLGRTIGMLYSQRARALCTAFCVGDDIIATAAHCFFRTAQDPLPPVSDFVFRRDSADGRHQSGLAGQSTPTKAQFVLSGSMRLSVRPPIEASRDWALARLAQPICRGNVLKLRPMPAVEIARHADAGRMYQIAYHRDYGSGRLAYSRDCTVQHSANTPVWDGIARDFVNAENLILHTCDTGGASSGSPLFVDTPEGPAVVGINVGTYVQSRVALRGGEVVRRYRAHDIANTGVNITALADKLGAFARAPILASNGRIRTLQTQLKSRAVYRGSLDGAYGPKLKQAIETYERAQNMPVTGLATETLLQRLSDTRANGLPSANENLRGERGVPVPTRPQRGANAAHRTSRAD